MANESDGTRWWGGWRDGRGTQHRFRYGLWEMEGGPPGRPVIGRVSDTEEQDESVTASALQLLVASTVGRQTVKDEIDAKSTRSSKDDDQGGPTAEGKMSVKRGRGRCLLCL